MRKLSGFLLLLLLLAVPWARAFPPAPFYTLYGTVRDQVGQRITAEGAEVILLKGGEEVGRCPITPTGLDKSYELNVRLDGNRSGTTLYSEKAVATGGQFSVVVEMNGARFYPIEVAGNLTAGKGAERIRLDLNLGEDLDRDGLPDIWEQWQLYQSGRNPDDSGAWDLSLIDRDGDLDGDGQSNWLEYVAGTFAGDADEHFTLEIKERQPGATRFEFFGVTGKTYTIESSPDMKTWTRIPFAIGEPGDGALTHQAADSRIVSAFAASSSTAADFYRLTVR